MNTISSHPSVTDRSTAGRLAFVTRWLALCLLLATLLLPISAGAAKSYRAERYDVDLAIQSDGALIVTETVAFRFEGGPFTFVFRDLAYTELDEIDRLQASLDGQPLPQGTGPGQVEIQAGKPLKVTWHFAPTSDATRTFTLVYRVQGAIRLLDGADALIWRAIPEEHEYEIAASTISLRYPASVALLNQPIVSVGAEIESDAGLVTITAQDIDEDQDLVVEARFPARSLISAAPAWQIAQAERREHLRGAWPLGAAAGVLTMVMGGGLLGWFWLRHPRPPTAPSVRLMTRTEPPSTHPPAVGVKLAGGAMPALATLFDLARRGVLRIEESPGRWGRKFVLQRQPGIGEGTSSLRPHEQGLLEALLRTKSGLEESLDLGKAGQQLASRQKHFNDPLEEELLAAGLLDGQRREQRQRLIILTVSGLVLGIIICIAGIILGSTLAANRAWAGLPAAAIVAGLGAGLSIIGFAGAIMASTFSILTPEGEEAAAAWRSFGDYLKDVARGRQELLRTALFDAYLPHAAGYGLAEGWAKRYQAQAGVAIPDWFTALRPEESGAAFVAVMAATHSSIGSSGSSAAGASGASGGGASGAG